MTPKDEPSLFSDGEEASAPATPTAAVDPSPEPAGAAAPAGVPTQDSEGVTFDGKGWNAWRITDGVLTHLGWARTEEDARLRLLPPPIDGGLQPKPEGFDPDAP